MGVGGSKWLSILLLELSLLKASSEVPTTTTSFSNNTIHDILLRDAIDNTNARKQIRQKRGLHSYESKSSRGSYTMDSASKRFHTIVDSTIPTNHEYTTSSMPTKPGTLWRQSLLTKVFNHSREAYELHSQTMLNSETEVLNSEHHNSFDSFILLFSRVPLPDGSGKDFGYSYISPNSPRGSEKAKGGKGIGESYYKGKSSSSKSSKKQSKRSVDPLFMYRQAPVQAYDFYPIRPVHYLFSASPPQPAPSLFSGPPLTQGPSGPGRPTMRPSTPPPTVQNPSPSPVQNPSPSPIQNPSPSPIEEPSARPSVSLQPPPSPAPIIQASQSPSRATASISTCQWTVCGDIMSNRCTGIFLEPSNNVRIAGNPNGVELAVRCCSNTQLPNFKQFAEEPTCPFAGSSIDGQCYKEVVYQEAVGLCSSIGARLCTKAEMELRCTFGSGCDFNNLQIWTSTSGVFGYFEDSENSFKVVTAGAADTEIQTTFPCRGGQTAATSIGMLTFDENACTAECRFRIPYTQYRRYCTENPEGAFSFTIPGPFTAGFELYIGNAASSWDLPCEVQLSVSNIESNNVWN
ncbi:unnamed protein product [Cylindrotheca closterium]|uniref:Uncharacterized protein n=1 Tax=Cylindrotheca closterium TaxID=2856 RepID=A0AAD2G4E8_9STRA|nr:unnamed protein product [Cylindrotheca closterium]